MNQNDKMNEVGNAEISVKDVFIKAQNAAKFLKSKWVTIIAFAFLGAACGIAYSILKKTQYTATCTFVLDDGNKSGAGHLSGLAAMAGIDIGGSSNGIFSGDNIIELYKSRLMLEKTLLSEVDFYGKKQLLINHYIDFNKLRSKWRDKDHIDNISFYGDASKFNRKQDSIISDIVDKINKKALSVIKLDKKLDIIYVQFTSDDELFAQRFTNTLVETVNDFYAETKTKKSKANVELLQREADSVKLRLNSSINGVASAIDASPNANSALLTLKVPSQRKQIDVQANSAIYSEIMKNLELSKINLQQETPLIQIIDSPVLPLEANHPGKIKFGVLGLILGSISTIFFLLFSKIVAAIIK
jgi:uncharacterized protein involved in exopolysaccharide biosynthesis